MASRKEIENTRHTVEGLAGMARELGYKSPFGQLILNNGASVSDILEFFEDNPGAIEAVVNWVLETGTDRNAEPFTDDEDEENCDDSEEICEEDDED